MPNPRFNIELIGADVSPETIRASELAEFVTNLETAIVETATAHGLPVPEGAIVSLVGVEEGSNRLTMAVVGAVVAAAGAVSAAVKSGNYADIPVPAHSALHDVSTQAVRREWLVRFSENRQLGIQAATISEEHQVPAPPTPAVASGTTTVYGRCIRVGGVIPRAEIRLEAGGLLHISVSERMAKDLAVRLYELVCIEGTALWRTADWSLQDFTATRVLPFRSTDPADAFERLAEAAKGRWDGVDAIGYVRALRTEGEQR